MNTKFAFVGFRHGHIMSLYDEVVKRDSTIVAAACEEDKDTREKLQAAGKVDVKYSSFSQMLKEVDCDVVAIGDYFARRGSLAIQALQAGKHVLADKPLCTSLDELNKIRELSLKNNLCVNCMLTMRDTAGYQTMRKLLLEDTIGTPQSIIITGQHPLGMGSRPQWYFMPACHGGTITDIGIHVFDVIPWLTGQIISDSCAARSWNGKAKDYPWFKDCAQFMLKLENGCGVLADVSYLSPDKCGYAVRQYWRCEIAGQRGIMEYQNGDKNIFLAKDDDAAPQEIPVQFVERENYLDDILNEIAGKRSKCHSTTASVLETHRLALEVQAAALE